MSHFAYVVNLARQKSILMAKIIIILFDLSESNNTL